MLTTTLPSAKRDCKLKGALCHVDALLIGGSLQCAAFQGDTLQACKHMPGDV